MVRFPIWLCLAIVFSGGGGLEAADPLSPATAIATLGPSRGMFESENCRITAVNANDDGLTVEFTGRWVSSADIKWADTDKHAFSVTPGKSVPKVEWRAFADRFKSFLHKTVSLSVSAGNGWAIRGGVPLFDYPLDRFQIVHDGVKFDITPVPTSPGLHGRE